MKAELKAKKAIKEAKESIVELAKEIKGVSINLDFENKKHTIEVQTQ